MPMFSKPLSHILICRTDNIGDTVLTLPLAGYLKSQYPGIRVDFLCRSYVADVIRSSCFVDEVITLEALTDPVSYFAQSGIDTIIFAFPNKVLARAAKQASIARRIGTSHRLFHWLTCNKLVRFSRVKSDLHEAQLNFSLLRPLGLSAIPDLAAIPAWYGLSANEDVEIQALFAPHAFNLILHPKSNGHGREWPIGHYVELARLLQAADHSIHCWITGSAAEGEWIAQYGDALLRMPNVTNICGQFNLAKLASAIARADGLIASGTGPLHVSAALGTRTLGLFPPVKPVHPGRWAPLGQQTQVLCQTACVAQSPACQAGAACACMQSITPAEVVEVVLGWKGLARNVFG